ncbi:hypothetical protein HDE76_003374 [Rhodanobacter sp. ANJX3]|uniref:hypothetical protein n=1 Tax=unclassified Rhodanobacter TaxID=2621553 RepID=UPI0015CD03EC|nr:MULTISPECIES: hypothetical protein [unclassified Rhodanobacter]MBB5360132.1 hypothetical protein [Rhodanobacter sp. ANJX3]NYE29055.1 hypothetical protein [Rhodanobacter sp. K2T2]
MSERQGFSQLLQEIHNHAEPHAARVSDQHSLLAIASTVLLAMQKTLQCGATFAFSR